jgi:hypothetical protein
MSAMTSNSKEAIATLDATRRISEMRAKIDELGDDISAETKREAENYITQYEYLTKIVAEKGKILDATESDIKKQERGLKSLY